MMRFLVVFAVLFLNFSCSQSDAQENSGGEGLIYWDPVWVFTNCSTLWGQGSHWDNATLFDFNNQSTLGMQFYNASFNN